jgi:hypothetical protein
MKKIIEKFKKNYKDDSRKSAMVVLGTVGGALLSKGARYLTKDSPSLNTFATYAMPVLMAGGGLIVATNTEKESSVKYVAYGLAAAGVLQGILLVPFFRDNLLGMEGLGQGADVLDYYTESANREQIMEGFGLAALPVVNTYTEDAATFKPQLPELEEVSGTQDLGFTPIANEDTDIRGII